MSTAANNHHPQPEPEASEEPKTKKLKATSMTMLNWAPKTEAKELTTEEQNKIGQVVEEFVYSTCKSFKNKQEMIVSGCVLLCFRHLNHDDATKDDEIYCVRNQLAFIDCINKKIQSLRSDGVKAVKLSHKGALCCNGISTAS